MPLISTGVNVGPVLVSQCVPKRFTDKELSRLRSAQPEPDINRSIDLKLVAQGAGSPDSWPEASRFSDTMIPSLTQLEPGHKVRCHV